MELCLCLRGWTCCRFLSLGFVKKKIFIGQTNKGLGSLKRSHNAESCFIKKQQGGYKCLSRRLELGFPPADLLSCLKHKRGAAAPLKNGQIIATIRIFPTWQ